MVEAIDFDAIMTAIADGSKFGVIAGGMWVAYRLNRKASADAIAVYQQAAADADKRLAVERAAWAAEKSALLAQIKQMQDDDRK